MTAIRSILIMFGPPLTAFNISEGRWLSDEEVNDLLNDEFEDLKL